MGKKIKTVPNQRVLQIHKEPTNKKNLYTVNNLDAIDQASFRLQSKCGFKLYMYLAKNQNDYRFALSSSHFVAGSGCGLGAYNSAFDELVDEGYLVETPKGTNVYIFYDKSKIPSPKTKDKEPTVIIDKQEPEDFVF